MDENKKNPPIDYSIAGGIARRPIYEARIARERRSKSVKLIIEHAMIESDEGPISGLCIECSKCEHVVEVYGREHKSIRYGAALMRQQCPLGEQNYYRSEE